jgi:hypothetical protein
MSRRRRLEKPERTKKAESLSAAVKEGQVTSLTLLFTLTSKPSTTVSPLKAPSEDKVASLRREEDLKSEKQCRFMKER